MMKVNKTTAFLSVVLLLVCATSASADTLRCGNKLVKTGSSKAEVRLACGEPFDVDYVANQRRGNQVFKVERLTYVFGEGKLLKILEFRNGKLHSIENGPRQ